MSLRSTDYASLLLERDAELDERQEKLAALVVAHDEDLQTLAEALPALRRDALKSVLEDALAEVDRKIQPIVGARVSERVAEAQQSLSAEQTQAASAAQARIEALRTELIALARDAFAAVSAERQRTVSLEEIRTTLSALAKEAAYDVARTVVGSESDRINARMLELLAVANNSSPTGALIADAFRGQFTSGKQAKRGELWMYRGSTYICLKDTTEVPARTSAWHGKGSWGMFASVGAMGPTGDKGADGSGGGGGGYVSPPATPTSSGTQGQWSYDAGYMYQCVADNTWRQWPATTF